MHETNLDLLGKNIFALITLGLLTKSLVTKYARLAYKKQRNICATILRKPSFENLDVKNLSDNRKFCRSVKPLISNKVKSIVYATLNENDPLIRNKYNTAKNFNNFFINVVPNHEIKVD